MCHVGMWRDREAALAAGDRSLAMRLAYRIAGLPSDNAADVQVKAALLAELEEPEAMPTGAIAGLLIAGLERETRLVAAGKIPLI